MSTLTQSPTPSTLPCTPFLRFTSAMAFLPKTSGNGPNPCTTLQLPCLCSPPGTLPSPFISAMALLFKTTALSFPPIYLPLPTPLPPFLTLHLSQGLIGHHPVLWVKQPALAPKVQAVRCDEHDCSACKARPQEWGQPALAGGLIYTANSSRGVKTAGKGSIGLGWGAGQACLQQWGQLVLADGLVHTAHR